MGHRSTLDGARLHQLAEVAQQVNECCAFLTEGPTGLGRARYQGEKAVGHIDAGAASVALIMASLAATACGPA